MLIIKPVILCISVLIIVIILNNLIPEFVPVIMLICGIGVIIYILPYLESVLNTVNTLKLKISSLTPMIKIILKIIAISLSCEFASQLCRDCGQGYLSSKINFAGKIIAMSSVSPIIIEFIEYIIEMSSEI